MTPIGFLDPVFCFCVWGRPCTFPWKGVPALSRTPQNPQNSGGERAEGRCAPPSPPPKHRTQNTEHRTPRNQWEVEQTMSRALAGGVQNQRRKGSCTHPHAAHESEAGPKPQLTVMAAKGTRRTCAATSFLGWCAACTRLSFRTAWVQPRGFRSSTRTTPSRPCIAACTIASGCHLSEQSYFNSCCACGRVCVCVCACARV